MGILEGGYQDALGEDSMGHHTEVENILLDTKIRVI
jgi:hypothetical protein